MKKLFASALFAAGLLVISPAFAQQGAAPTPAQILQVIASIPALQNIHQEIEQFEAKTAGQKEQFEHANADLKALKMKYANELQTQIAANAGKPEILAVLNEELTKTNAEIAQIK